KIRFESLPEVFPRLQPAAARYMVVGSYERRADWKLYVQVEVRAAVSPADPAGTVLASATRMGSVDEAPTLAVAAALEALAAVPGIKLDPATLVDRSVGARFGRDPYA